MEHTKQVIVKTKFIDVFCKDMQQRNCDRALLVCSNRVVKSEIGQAFIDSENIGSVFSEFEPNPTYDSVVHGVEQFRNNSCDAVIAIGGGSAIDVAKTIKAYAGMHSEEEYIQQEIVDSEIPLYVMPTTAGTGSEATQFAVIYYKGEKISVDHSSLLPDFVFMNPELLSTLPEYQKKATMLDAYCHSVESFWSAGATPSSQDYAKQAIAFIKEYADAYLAGDCVACEQMLEASNLAGRAINITKTTAAHAMCYKLTKLYGISHGHAAALCLAKVWRKTILLANKNKNEVLLTKLGLLTDDVDMDVAVDEFEKWLIHLKMNLDFKSDDKDLATLVESVNLQRLKNHPVAFSKEEIKEMYQDILGL